MRDNQTTRRMPMIVTAMACATASMLAGLALAPSAMAADTTITLQGADGASLAGHTFDVYRIGTYTDQVLDGTRISSLGVRGDTASNAWAADAIGIANAYDPSTADDIAKVYGYDDAGNIANIKMDSQTRQLRNISKALGQSAKKPAPVAGGANLMTTRSTLTINVPAEGLYYITDSEGNPIMIGTKSGNANIMKNDAKDPQWRTLGTAVVKAKSVRVDKKVQVSRDGATVGKDGTASDPVGVTVGDTVTNTVEVTVPNKQAASAVKFKLVDQPKGQTYVKGSLSVRLKNAPRTDITADAVVYDGTTQNNAKSIPGDPQPDDLKAYSEKSDKDYDPLKDPSIDQSLLGHTYQVVMPMTVTKVKDGHTVENTATQVTNDRRDKTNTVTNPLKEINPTKDVTVQVGGDSVDGKSVYLNHTFLYRLDSSILPPGRAYQTVTDWGGTDQLATEYDRYLGNWAVYASRDLYRDGQVLAAKGEKIAGSGFDSSKFGGNLFTVDADENGKVTADATQAYLDLVSADNEHEAGWVLYLQCKRIAVADEVPNTWTETINGQPRESNKVITKTPDMTPSIHLEKVDTPTLKQDGQERADRDDPKQALKMDADSIGITFIITNTSKTDPATGDGAWFKASDLNLADSTIVGDAHVDMDSLTYPADWDTLVLKPGESVSVTGTLKGVKEGDTHTDRAIVTGTPLVECAPSNGDPFNDKTDGGEDTDPEYSTGDVTEIDGKQLCADTQTASNTDDWNGYRAKPLASTGVAVLGLAGGALAVLLAGGSLLVFRKRHCAQGSGRHTAVNAGK